MGFEKLYAKAKAKLPTPDISPEQQANLDREQAAKLEKSLKEVVDFHSPDKLPTCTSASDLCMDAYKEMLVVQQEAGDAIALALTAVEKYSNQDFLDNGAETDDVYWQATKKAFEAIQRKNDAIDRFNQLLMQGESN